jgi:hypothetical protein
VASSEALLLNDKRLPCLLEPIRSDTTKKRFAELWPALLEDSDVGIETTLRQLRCHVIDIRFLQIGSDDTFFGRREDREPQLEALYKKYRDHGMPEITLRDSLNEWRRFCIYLTQIHSPLGRAHITREAGTRLGRLIGSLTYKTLAM